MKIYYTIIIANIKKISIINTRGGKIMYLIGIVGRHYQNKDNQSIIQIHEQTRRFLIKEKNITCITILPTDAEDLSNIEPGEDKINKEKLDFILNMSLNTP